MIYFLHNFLPNPIFWEFGPVVIRYYGLIITLAIVVAIGVASQLNNHSAGGTKFKFDDLLDLAFWLIIFGVVGARIYEVIILEPVYFFSHPFEIMKIWHGGLAIHGAIIAGIITLIIWHRIKKHNFWQWADVAAVVLPLAQAIGRWGNYFNQEVFGWPTNLPWGIPIAIINRPIEFINEKYFQPTFLYESILNLILFAIMFISYQKRQLKLGQYFGLYLIGYGLIRFTMEFIRIDHTALIGGFRWPQILSLILICIGVMIFYQRKTSA